MDDPLVGAVDGISPEVGAGQFVALLGSSCSGKSSLLNLIAGLDRPSSGAVMVNGHNLAETPSQELSRVYFGA
jgi:putative ABC transport system ATP-binding protein